MIATGKSLTPRRERAVPAVDDPRRSYDRGVWSGAEAEAGTDADVGAGGDAEPGIRNTARRGAGPDLASVSLDALRRELDRRQKELETLLARRERLAQELATLDAQLAELEGSGATSRTSRSRESRASGRGQPARLALPRQKNSISLPDAVALEAEVGQIVTPPEIAKRVLAGGYQTTSKTFTAMITNTLSKDARFRRVGRGRYERIGA